MLRTAPRASAARAIGNATIPVYCFRRGARSRSSGKHLHLDGSPRCAAGCGSRNPAGLGRERHFGHGARSRDPRDQRISYQGPVCRLEQGNEHWLIAKRIQNGVAQGIGRSRRCGNGGCGRRFFIQFGNGRRCRPHHNNICRGDRSRAHRRHRLRGRLSLGHAFASAIRCKRRNRSRACSRLRSPNFRTSRQRLGQHRAPSGPRLRGNGGQGRFAQQLLDRQETLRMRHLQ